ncbi:MAG TPA: hypothetical protein DDZ80_27230 [Cyanobacteria bacterium UBA8803]|nr:hypothetical protein [Cyanobacteria bacterium UBA9273]HBL61967.1 hypothetical protein [Cyanobacteria bacterium UBA8803]
MLRADINLIIHQAINFLANRATLSEKLARFIYIYNGCDQLGCCSYEIASLKLYEEDYWHFT